MMVKHAKNLIFCRPANSGGATIEELDRVDFIYLDVECAEFDVLHGAIPLLLNVSVLHLEVTTERLCEGGPTIPLKHNRENGKAQNLT
mgnify:CR=1 FL=1